MSIYSPESEVLARHLEQFQNKKILIVGECRDSFPFELEAETLYFHTHLFHIYEQMQRYADESNHVEFSTLPSIESLRSSDTVIYYWPKNKKEAFFQLNYLFSQLSTETDIFVIGENRSGVKSVESLFGELIATQKIDGARRCGLYHIDLLTHSEFNVDKEWVKTNYPFENRDLTLWSMPGVFSYKGLDEGSRFLIDTLSNHRKLIKGSVLDIGCGCGVIGLSAALINPDINLTASDVSSAAITSTQKTLTENGVAHFKVVASDVFSQLSEKYDCIISNPPFHDGMKVDYRAIEQLIAQAKQHLAVNGSFCFVANSFLPYEPLIQKGKYYYEVLASNSKYKIYLIR